MQHEVAEQPSAAEPCQSSNCPKELRRTVAVAAAWQQRLARVRGLGRCCFTVETGAEDLFVLIIAVLLTVVVSLLFLSWSSWSWSRLLHCCCCHHPALLVCGCLMKTTRTSPPFQRTHLRTTDVSWHACCTAAPCW